MRSFFTMACIGLAMLCSLPATVSAQDFTGFTIGGGWGFQDTEVKVAGEGVNQKFGDETSEGVLFAGYDFAFGEHLRIGVEGDVGLADIDVQLDEDQGFLGDLFDGSGWSVSGRAGWVFAERFMIYAKAGFAQTEIAGRDFNGVRFGVGAEAYTVWRLFLRGELLRDELSSKRSNTLPASISPDSNRARILVGLRF